MIVFRNLNLVKTYQSDRVDIARQLNLQVSNASSLSLVFNTKEEISEFSLGISSFIFRDDYVLSGQYVIDNKDLANPLTSKHHGDLAGKVLVISSNLLDVFNPNKTLKSVLKFLLKARGGAYPESMSSELQFVGLDETFLSSKVKDLSILDRVKLFLLLAVLLQINLLIFESIETALDDAEMDQVLTITEQFRINTGASCLFLTTDYDWAIESSDSVGVLQAGLLLEYGSSIELARKPLHPMTLALKQENFPKHSAPVGCPYAAECGAKFRVSENLCLTTVPVTVSITDTHILRCHLSAEERSAYYSEVNSGNT